MTSKRTIRQVAVALMLLVAFLLQGTWALAGTTGGVGGYVTDDQGKPVAGASVKVLSASQVASATTDASGHFTFLSLAPDTYTLSIAKDGFAPFSEAGITVFADNNLALTFQLQRQLKTIASVTSTAAGALVKAGVGGDVYNVNSSQIAAAASLGGGGNLNSAYSAIASVPGVSVPLGGSGWNSNSVYIRGSQSWTTGFEYDGIPVNRAFDNYNASTESSLGLQELQVYTGGGPASVSSGGTSGFINQVIKTGTYPGYANFTGGIGSTIFYHQAEIEAGGASPDRNFSYYVGISGYNQAFRTLDQSNGADLEQPGEQFASYGFGADSSLLNGVPQMETPICNAGTNVTPSGVTSLPWFAGEASTVNPIWGYSSNCLTWFPGNYGNQSQIADRENVVNFHFGIPRKNGLRDDLQVLWSASMLNTQYNSQATDFGGGDNGYDTYTLATTGMYYCPPSGVGGQCAQMAAELGGSFPFYPSYTDAVVYNAPFGTPIANLTTQNYYQPDSATDRAPGAELPDNLQDGIFNDQGIVKIQYTHALNENAFVRAFAYTFFSDWTQAGANSAYSCYEWGLGPLVAGCGVAANYDLITHTTGGELEFVDQINPQNLVQATVNFTTANVVRSNNDGYTAGASPIGLISYANGQFTCYDPTTGDALATGCAPGGTYQSNAIAGPTGNPPAGSAAANAGAQWVTLWQGNANGSYNTVSPKFGQAILSDQWRPTDKILITAALRGESYVYDLDSANSLANDFYAQIIANDVCVNSVGTVYSEPLAPTAPPPAKPIYTTTCPAGFTHPPFTAGSPSSYSLGDVSPRLSGTYTESPDTVWRASIGKFTQPPDTASVQYLANGGNETSVWTGALPLGFESPFHAIPLQEALQADLSLERHIRGTDMSFKLTPFWNMTSNYYEEAFIGPNFVTITPAGRLRSYGVEGSFQKGDFSRDGLSGVLNVTYTNAAVQFQSLLGENQVDAVNSAITQFNMLTSAGGGCPYYTPGGSSANNYGCVAAGTAPGATAVQNPYYNMAAQPLLNDKGWYPGVDVGISTTSNPNISNFNQPWVSSLILNYRHQRWAITPSLQLSEGAGYGGPLAVAGEDPRTCGQNSATAGITAVSPNTNPYQCDAYSDLGTASTAAGKLFIPNPQTGTFASIGEYQNPWIMVGNLQLSYDVSPRISVNVTMADLFHTCFGGSKEAWTSIYTPGTNTCGYFANSLYYSNFYNGTGPGDSAANGFTPPQIESASYAPTAGSDAGFVPLPFNVYVTVKFKI